MTVQTLTIQGWHPHTNVNGDNARRHWSVIRRNHDIDRDTAWAAAKQAGWVFVPGKVKLTITLVYARKYRVDADNLHSRVKGILDGLTGFQVRKPFPFKLPKIAVATYHGFFTDDSTDYLDLVVRAEVVPGCKQVRIELEPVEVLA